MIDLKGCYIYCPACGKYTELKTDDIEPLDLMCGKCDLVIASIKEKKQP